MIDKMGYGMCPVGISRIGFGQPASINSVAEKLYKMPDGSMGDTPLIDFKTGDFVTDESGNMLGAYSTPQMVQLALFTMKNSSAVDGFGFEANDYTGPINIQILKKVKRAVASSLKHMVDANLIIIADISVERSKDNQIEIYLQWIDVLNNELTTTTVMI